MPLKITNKGVFFIAVSQFGMAFSFSFMIAFMPFYIVKISTFGPKETMLWIGMIIGVPNIIMALIAPFWGGLTSRFSPKLLFERGILCNGILILLMGFIDNLYLLLLLRIMQGAFGGVSTIGLVLISSLSPEERLHKDLSLFQNSLTAGQLMGPPLGTYTASLFGYRGAFVIASIIVSIFLTFCHHYVSDIPLQKKKSHPEAYYKKGLLSGWVLSLIATVQLTFLPSILPRILENFQLMEGAALNYAGIIIMSYSSSTVSKNEFN